MKQHKKDLFLRNANATLKIVQKGCNSPDCEFNPGPMDHLPCRCGEILEGLGRQLEKEAISLRPKVENKR